MMKLLMLITSFMISFSALAETHEFGRADIGTIKISLLDVGPIYARFEMHISVLCKDRRSLKNLVTPTWEDVLPKENICVFSQPRFNESTTELTITFGTSKFGPGQARCNQGWTQKFNLKELCSAWAD